MCSWAVKKLLTHTLNHCWSVSATFSHGNHLFFFYTWTYCRANNPQSLHVSSPTTVNNTSISHGTQMVHTSRLPKRSGCVEDLDGLDAMKVWMLWRNRTLHRLGLLSLFDYTIRIHSGLMLASKLVQQWLDFLKEQKLCQIGCILQHNTLNLDKNQLHL